jgi:hypothetical protein
LLGSISLKSFSCFHFKLLIFWPVQSLFCSKQIVMYIFF